MQRSVWMAGIVFVIATYIKLYRKKKRLFFNICSYLYRVGIGMVDSSELSGYDMFVRQPFCAEVSVVKFYVGIVFFNVESIFQFVVKN